MGAQETDIEEWLEDELEECPRCGGKKLVPPSALADPIRICLQCGVVAGIEER
jgi:hypothetical protein